MSEVDDFIAHFGKKGMRWGTRKAPGGHIKLTGGQKVKIGAAGALAGLVASNVIAAKTLNVKLAFVGGAAAGIAGGRAARNIIDNKGSTPLKEVT